MLLKMKEDQNCKTHPDLSGQARRHSCAAIARVKLSRVNPRPMHQLTDEPGTAAACGSRVVATTTVQDARTPMLSACAEVARARIAAVLRQTPVARWPL
jgi:hypothetical protein